MPGNITNYGPLTHRRHGHLCPAAGRAGHDLQAAFPQPQRLQGRDADLDLLDRRGGQRHPEACPGHAEVRRVVAARSQLPVSVGHRHRVVVLDRDLDVGEPVLPEQRALA